MSSKIKSQEILVSIIIPVYNVENFLQKCLESILKQTYTHFELVLVDDGSTDKSGEICDIYAKLDNRIHVIHSKNQGVSHARNLGIEACNGDWICFVDSDDEVTNNWLECYIDQNDADLLIQGMVIKEYPNKKQIISLPNLLLKAEERLNLKIEIYNKTLNSPCKCFKAKIIQDNHLRFTENIHLAEDLIFVLQYIGASQSVRLISHEGYIYNRQNSTLTKRFYPTTSLLAWNNVIINTALSICQNNRKNILYQYIAEHQFKSLSQYVTLQYFHISRKERWDIYDLLWILYRYVHFKHMKWTRQIFFLLFLPKPIFDLIILIMSYLYTSILYRKK